MFGRSWQGVLAYVYLQIEVGECFAVFLAADVKCQCVCSGFGIVGDFECAPYGPHLHGLEFQRSVAVYAVGDVRVKSLRQVVTAVADGAIAAVQVERSMSEY